VLKRRFDKAIRGALPTESQPRDDGRWGDISPAFLPACKNSSCLQNIRTFSSASHDQPGLNDPLQKTNELRTSPDCHSPFQRDCHKLKLFSFCVFGKLNQFCAKCSPRTHSMISLISLKDCGLKSAHFTKALQNKTSHSCNQISEIIPDRNDVALMQAKYSYRRTNFTTITPAPLALRQTFTLRTQRRSWQQY
jgi:hypothetical protein